MALVDGAQLIIPQIIRSAVDALDMSLSSSAAVARQCGFIILLGLGMAVLRYCWRNLLMGSARDVERGIRDEIFTRVMSLDMACFDRLRTGDIMARATSDINHIRMAFGFGLIAMVDTVLLGGSTLAIMLFTHPELTLVSMIPMPFLVITTRILGKKMYALHETAQESYSRMTELIRENFFGIRILKVFNFEEFINRKVADSAYEYFRKNLKRAVVTALLKPMLGLFFNLSTLVIVVYGGFLAMKKVITAGELAAFIQYLAILAWPVVAIGWMTNLFQRGMASLERVNQLLETRPVVSSPEHGIDFIEKGRDIRFENVWFSHDDETFVLSDICLDIPEGACIGISGPPGSGKTSLVNLIPRLYDADRGRILFSGKDIRQFDLDFLRQNIALMPQEPFLFSGTIMDNIGMGRDVDMKKLESILEICCLEHTIGKMPRGLDTMVGEGGVTLSGGQKQRIALARTLIQEKPVIILDDPISQVDTKTACAIISGIKTIVSTTTCIIISHRISALAPCDVIHILENGRILHSGTHEHLAQVDSFYGEAMHVQQFEENHGL